MAEQPDESRIVEKKIIQFLSLFTFVIGIMIFFGYTVGKDMAVRDNARDAAVANH